MKSLKEWAAIVRALEDGGQTIILRKGGILETASGFELAARKFLLFPTLEHQNAAHLREEHKHYMDRMPAIQEGGAARITSYAEVLAEADIPPGEDVRALNDFHVWSEKYIDSRRAWMPERPLRAVFLKVYMIPEIEVPERPEHRGCRSWIEINAQPRAGEPVLGESEVHSRLERFQGIVH